MARRTKPYIIAHKHFTPYEEACIVVLALLGIYALLTLSGVIGSLLNPSTNPAVLFGYMLIEWGIPIVFGVFGLVLGIIGLSKLKKKQSPGNGVKATVYGITIFFSVITLLSTGIFPLLILL